MRVIVIEAEPLGKLLQRSGVVDDVVVVEKGTHPNVAVKDGIAGLPRHEVRQQAVFLIADNGSEELRNLPGRLASRQLRSVWLGSQPIDAHEGLIGQAIVPITPNGVLETLEQVTGASVERIAGRHGQVQIGAAAADRDQQATASTSNGQGNEDAATDAQPDSDAQPDTEAGSPPDVPAWAADAAQPQPASAPEPPAEPPADVPGWAADAVDATADTPAWEIDGDDPAGTAPVPPTADDTGDEAAAEPATGADRMDSVDDIGDAVSPDPAPIPEWAIAAASGDDALGADWGVEAASEGFQPARATTTGQLLAFASYKGGAGKTTVTISAAATLAEELADKRVLLIDGNTAQTSVSTILQMRQSSKTILDAVQSPFDPQRLRRSIVRVPDTKLDVLLGAPTLRTADTRIITPQLYQRIVNVARDDYDYILLDTPVAQAIGEPLFAEFVVKEADRLVVVTEPNTETIANNLEWLEALEDPVAADGANFPQQTIAVVLNQAKDGVGWDEQAVRKRFARWAWLGAVRDSDEIAKANNDARLHLVSSDARDDIVAAMWLLTGEQALNQRHVKAESNGSRKKGGLLRRRRG